MTADVVEERRGHRVMVSFSDREYEQIKKGAKEIGLRVSTYVRVASLQGNHRLKRVMAEHFDTLKSNMRAIEEEASGREDT